MHTTILGTGLIGAGLAEATAQRGLPVHVWNRTHERARPLGQHGCTVHETTASAVAHSDVIHLALTADDAVDAVLNEALDAATLDAIWVDHSTTDPERTRGRVARIHDAGRRFIHAPVFMSPASCRSCSGVMLVSGPKSVFDAAAEHLGAMTGTLRYMGPQGHEAATLKLAGNAMILAVNAGLADAMTLASHQGVPPNALMGLFEHLDIGVSLKGRGGRMAADDRSVSWTLQMAAKDADLMLGAAGEHALHLLPAVRDRMQQLIDEGEAAQDLSILARDVPR